jgi:hypothetical protein
MAAATPDRAEVDTARPFRSVREAVAVFGDRIIVGESHSRSNASSVAVATSNANAIAIPAAKHEASSSSTTITLSPNPTAESEAEAAPAVVPMYSAPSSPPSLASSPPSPNKTRGEVRRDVESGLTIVRSIEKLEAEVAGTRLEVAQLRKRSTEMEMAVASLNAQLHRGLSRLAEMEADKAAAAARRSFGGDTDVASTVRSERYWGANKLGSSDYLPSFSHALSLGELDDDVIGGRGGRRRGKVKPIVPLIGGILFSKRKSTKEKGDGMYSGDLYSVLG